MRIDEQVRRCTSFLVLRKEVEEGLEIYPVGTVFCVCEKIAQDRWINYAVTARHVIDGSRPHGPLGIRCVTPDGGRTKFYALSQDRWWVHPTSDVAVAPLTIPLAEYGIKVLPMDLLATGDWIREHDVGPGDHVVTPGLFSQYVGVSRDEPVLRFGRIALVPSQPLRIPAQGPHPSMELDAVLAELASWGGQSGSPVFVYFGADRDLFRERLVHTQVPSPKLLGLLQGHYLVSQRVDEIPGGRIPMNSGIAIVVPASKILEVLGMDPAKEYREWVLAHLRNDVVE
jgi:hypothetical protein